MVELVVWDWNGTILSDTWACIAAGNHFLTTFGGKPISRSRYVATFKFPIIEFYVLHGADRKALEDPESAKVFHNHYEANAKKCRTRKGSRETLRWLHEQGIPSIILSNHMQEAIIGQLERLGLPEYIHQVLANSELADTATGLNKVKRLRRYVQQKGYNPENAVIVGDATEDINIGKDLGMTTVAITGGYFSTPRLRAAEPDHLIGNNHQLKEILLALHG